MNKNCIRLSVKLYIFIVSVLDKQLCDISKGTPNRTASEVISAIENERNEIVIEPFYRKFGFFIKEIWPDFYFKYFRSKF